MGLGRLVDPRLSSLLPDQIIIDWAASLCLIPFFSKKFLNPDPLLLDFRMNRSTNIKIEELLGLAFPS
jgi:hypothetical protein